MKNPYRIGESIYLRPLERADAPRMAAWFNDYDVSRTTSRYRPFTVVEQERMIDQHADSKDDVVVGIIARATDELVGVIGLHGVADKNRRAMLGIAIGEKAEWGRGYATEASRLMLAVAFETLNLHRVWLDVFADNARALRCYDKLGFKRDGVLREHVFRDGAYCDLVYMSMLRDEWSR